MDILDQLWYGEVKPVALYSKDACYEQLEQDYKEVVQKVMAALSREQQIAVDQLLDMKGTIASIDEHNAFTTGFRLGVQMLVAGMETLSFSTED